MRKPLLILAICAGSAASASSASAQTVGLRAATSSAAADSAAAPGTVVEKGAASQNAESASGAAVPRSDAQVQGQGQVGASLPDEKGKTPGQRAALAVTNDPSAAVGRPFFFRGTSQFRTLAISDEDPANGQALIWALEAGYKVTPKASVFVRAGFLQRFVVPSTSTELIPEGLPLPSEAELESMDTSPFLFRDVVVGGRYRQSFDLPELFGDRHVDLFYTLNMFLPTSLASQRRDLTIAPELFTRARVNVLESLYAGVDVSGQYRFHRTAERYGMGAGQNVQTQLTAAVVADYQIANLGDWGLISAGADVRWAWEKTYASRDDFEAESSSRNFWRQDYGWDLYASYMPRSWLWVGISLEQSAPVLRDGIVNVRVPNRDETELVLTVQGTF